MDPLQVQSGIIVEVVQMKRWQETRVGMCSLQHNLGFEGVKHSSHAGCESTSPFIEISEDEAGARPDLLFEQIEQRWTLMGRSCPPPPELSQLQA